MRAGISITVTPEDRHHRLSAMPDRSTQRQAEARHRPEVILATSADCGTQRLLTGLTDMVSPIELPRGGPSARGTP